MKSYLNLFAAISMMLAFTECLSADSESAKSCPQAVEMEALDVASNIHDWDLLYKAYSSYLNCDDGAIAEGFTESVVKMLADDWVSIGKLKPLVKRNRLFLAFVYRHINESAGQKDLEKIVRNIKEKGCMNICQSICLEIKQRANSALKMM